MTNPWCCLWCFRTWTNLFDICGLPKQELGAPWVIAVSLSPSRRACKHDRTTRPWKNSVLIAQWTVIQGNCFIHTHECSLRIAGQVTGLVNIAGFVQVLNIQLTVDSQCKHDTNNSRVAPSQNSRCASDFQISLHFLFSASYYVMSEQSLLSALLNLTLTCIGI